MCNCGKISCPSCGPSYKTLQEKYSASWNPAPTQKKVLHQIKQQLAAYAAHHGINRWQAYEKLQLGQNGWINSGSEASFNPFNQHFDVKTPEKFTPEWPDIADLAFDICGVPDSHPCKHCEDNYAKMMGEDVAQYKPLKKSLWASAAPAPWASQPKAGDFTVQIKTSEGQTAEIKYAGIVQKVMPEYTNLDFGSDKIMPTQKKIVFEVALPVTASELANDLTGFATAPNHSQSELQIALQKIIDLKYEVDSLKAELAAKEKPKVVKKDTVSLESGDQLLISASEACSFKVPKQANRVIIRK